jgi:hypothetical protein
MCGLVPERSAGSANPEPYRPNIAVTLGYNEMHSRMTG